MNDDLAKDLRQNIKDFYEIHGKSFDKTRAFVWNEEKLAIEKIQDGMTVIDVGAGNGRFARLLPADVMYRGFEPSSTLRQAADPSLQIQDGGFPLIPAQDDISDVTVCFAVIQHLPTHAEREAAVAELIRITKPGGWIVVTSWHPTGELSRQTVTSIDQGESGDVWVGWKADGANAERYIHDFSFEEWTELWTHPLLKMERIGLFGRESWTDDLTQGRNWCVIAQKRS